MSNVYILIILPDYERTDATLKYKIKYVSVVPRKGDYIYDIEGSMYTIRSVGWYPPEDVIKQYNCRYEQYYSHEIPIEAIIYAK